MKKKYLINILFILFFIEGNAQDSIPHKTGINRSDYIEDLSNSINVSPIIFKTLSTFTIKGKEAMDYSQNDGFNVGVKFQHKWLGFAFSYSPKKLQEDKKGTSTATNFVLNSYGKKIGFDVYYLNCAGYYIQNFKGFPSLDSLVTDGRFPQRSDIQTLSTGFNLYYIFNSDKFSYRASFAHNECQKKTAGSFTITSSFNYYQIFGDSSILMSTVEKFAQEETKIKNGEFFSIGLMPGYAFTLVAKKNFFLTVAPSIGGMLQFQNYYTEHHEFVSREVLIPRYMARLGLGYSGRKFYYGLSMVGDAYGIPLARNILLNYGIGNAMFYFGIRLDVPKSLVKVSAFLEKCNPGNIFLQINKN